MPIRDRTTTLRRMQEIRRKYAAEMDTNLLNEPEYQLAKARFWAADAIIEVFLGIDEE